MGKRLSKIYTKTGDAGMTGLGDGNRVPKHDPRVDVMGHVDELNSQVGMLVELLDENIFATERDFLRRCQHFIFDLGGELSIPGFALISAKQVTALEHQLDTLNADLPPLDNFILPGGSAEIAQAHIARSVCRRAERALTALATDTEINPAGLQLLNRFSDLMFVLARHVARVKGIPEVLWEQDKAGRD